ncbi:MAG TPA: histidine phosphatase family protein [Myxococcaceae bacterium]|nr:histidine phosphatase family protein [Myxococcaceae bacterium]
MSQTNRVVVLVRHGETEWTKSKQHTGRQDIPLDTEGRREADLLRHRLAAWPFARVLVSPLSRARDTCVLAGLGDRAELRPDLMEFDYGAYEGRTREDILRERPDWSLWRDGCPQGETVELVGVRVDRILSEVRTIDGDVALFAHGHVLRILAARWLHAAPSFGERLALSTASVSVLGREHAAEVIWLWNDVSHLGRG